VPANAETLFGAAIFQVARLVSRGRPNGNTTGHHQSLYSKTNADLYKPAFKYTNFVMDIRVFTDGACSNNGKIGAKASWACWFPEHPKLSRAERVLDEEMQTNQRGELTAIAKAVEIALVSFPPADTNLLIFTDSMYSKNCLTLWLPSWIRKDWKNTQGMTVSHRDLIEKTATSLSKFKSFSISHVKAHTKTDDELSRNNAVADKMATDVLLGDAVSDEVKVVTNTQAAFEGFPLALMGPPMSETSLVQWCKANLDKLEPKFLSSALLSALTKTLKDKGFGVQKQRLHRSNMYRLVSKNHLIAEKAVIVKEE
jgi:ribonuclease HI